MSDIKGSTIILRPATITARRQIYEWLAHSDITHTVLGPPDFTDNPIPSWEEFTDDYNPQFFTGLYPENGRSYIIEANGEPVGHINYNEIDLDNHSVELNIWLAGSIYCNKGYGTDAINTLCTYIKDNMDCATFFASISLRNKAAIRTYEKCGFTQTHHIPEQIVPDYRDTIVLIKEVCNS
jgi:RimJ/RimL family protein N-acetyltransferase